MDMISELPDCILHSILSFLPAQYAARTSVLSSRWRHLWEEAPLRLDDESLCRKEQLVSRIFYAHRGPIENFRLVCYTRATIDGFVESAVKRGIRELTLLGYGRYSFELPPSLLPCNSLHQLSLRLGEFPQALHSIFPNLKELRLSCVKLHNDLLHILLSTCGSLDTLHLIDCLNPSVVSISSTSLRKFALKSSSWVDELIIKDTPNLESFKLDVYSPENTGVKVLDAPKLQFLGFLCLNFNALQLGENFYDLQETPSFHVKAMPCRLKILSYVKTLAIKITPTLDKTTPPDILRCFPFLENLFIMKEERIGSGYYPRWDEQCSLSFLNHLKTVNMRGFYGDWSDVELLRYLVLHGKVLKKVTLRCVVSVCQKFVETMRRQVSFEERESSDLELLFYQDAQNVDQFSPWKEVVIR
ncbi:F-box/RNI-like/FBD-like domains-containing protein [Rhynchospora pubera]|uniref:F-box/RNI-like/FBD-like domains-containing protein n=1 Tax=Rhynchospora pubera TaxID=906938 RepID=A0AAV8FUJ0_9POAL|nr:F-box/RNI-like/FBD-like domains-containing protein [Rhynchospora pubera]